MASDMTINPQHNDMETMNKERQNSKTMTTKCRHLRRTVLLLLLLLAESFYNGAWGADYIYHITTALLGDVTAVVDVNDLSSKIAIPDKLKRAYCTYTCYYLGGGGTHIPLTEGSSDYQTLNGAGVSDIYVEYELTADCPVTFCNDFASATWYNMKFYNQPDNDSNGVQWIQYFTVSGYVGQLWTNVSNPNDNGIADASDIRAYFAFLGDPYAFQVINKYAGSGMGARYDGSHVKIDNSPINWTWAAPNASHTGEQFRIVRLAEYGEERMYYWNPANTRYEGNARIGLWDRTTSQSSDARGFIVQAAAIPYTIVYTVVDNSGNEAVWYETTSTRLKLPDCLKSPAATNYRMYGSLEAARNDDGTSAYISANSITDLENAGENDGKKYVWIRYSLDTSQPLLCNDAPSYMLLDGDNSSYQHVGVFTQTNNSRGPVNTLKKGNGEHYWYYKDSWLWYFEGNDPYNIVLKNMYDTSKHFGTGTWNANTVVEMKDTESERAHFALLYHNFANATGMSLVVRPASKSGSFRFLYNNSENSLLLHETSIGSNDNRKIAQHLVNLSTGVTYFVINKQGEVAIYHQDKSPGATPQLPDRLKTPLATNYRYYLNYDFATKTFSNPITTLSSQHCRVYVDYDVVANPAIDIDGGTSYVIGFAAESKKLDGKTRYISCTANPLKAWNKTVSEILTDANTNNYLWTFTGGDPYDLRVQSVSNTNYYWYCDWGINSVPTTSSKNFLRYGEDTSPRLNRFIITESTGGTYALMYAGRFRDDVYFNYVGWLNNSSTNYPEAGIQYGTQSFNDDANGYLYDSDNVRLFIQNPYEVTVTYHIMSGTTELAKATVKQSSNKKPNVPQVLQSVLAVYTHFYKDAACTLEFGASETIGSETNIYVQAALAPGSSLDLKGTERLMAIVSEQNMFSSGDRWKLAASGQHPYMVKLQRVSDSQYLAVDGTVTSSTSAATLNVTTNSTGSTFFLREGADDSYELVLATTELDCFTDRYYTLGLDDNGNIKLISSETKPCGNADLQTQLVKNEVTYHVINLSGREALRYTPATLPDSYDSGFPDQFHSPLAKNYKYYKRNQFTITTVDGEALYTLNGSPTEATIVSPGDIYVTYEYDATAAAAMGIDLSGETVTTLFNEGPDGTDGPIMIGKCQRSDQPRFIGVKNRMELHEAWYEWRFYGKRVGDDYDPYQVKLKCETGGYLQPRFNDGIVPVGTDNNEPNRVDPPSRFIMLMKGIDANHFEMMTCVPNNAAPYIYLYYNGVIDNTNDYGLRYSRHTTNHRHGHRANQFFVQKPYRYHIITLKGEKSVCGLSPQFIVNGVTTPKLPKFLTSPLIAESGYKFYDITQFDATKVASGIYELKDGESPKTYMSDFTTSDIYVLYGKAAIKSGIDMTGQTSYNLQTHYISSNVVYNSLAYYDESASTTKVTGNNAPTDDDRIDDKYQWILTGSDPYDIAIYNKAMPTAPMTTNLSTSAYEGWSDFKALQFNSNDTYQRFALLAGSENGLYHLRLTKESQGSSYSGLAYCYMCVYRGDAIGVAFSNEVACFWDDKRNQIEIIQSLANARHTYVVVNNRGKRAIQMTVDGTRGAKPQMPEVLKSPFASGYTFYKDEACTEAFAANETMPDNDDPQTIYVRYTVQSNPSVNLQGQKAYYVLTGDGSHYVYADASDDLKLKVSNTPDNTSVAYRWTFDGQGDPYDLLLRLPGVDKDKALGTTAYTRPEGLRRNSPATVNNTLQMFDDDNEHVMGFAIINGNEKADHYALVATIYENAGTENTPADISGYEFDYIGFDGSDNATLQRGALTDSPNNIRSVDDDAQITTEDPPVTYYICDATGNVVMSKEYANSSELPTDCLPELLRRGFCSYIYYDSQADMLANRNGTAGGDGSAQGNTGYVFTGKPEVWARFTVNAPFRFLSSMDDLDRTDDSQWYALKNNIVASYAANFSNGYTYFYHPGTSNYEARWNWELDPQNNNYYFAFVGNPYSFQLACRYENTLAADWTKYPESKFVPYWTLHAYSGWKNATATTYINWQNDVNAQGQEVRPYHWAIDYMTDGGRFRMFLKDTYEEPYYLYPATKNNNLEYANVTGKTTRADVQYYEAGRVRTFHVVNREGDVAVSFSRIIRQSELTKTLAELMLDENADYRSPLATNYKFYSGTGAQELAAANTATSHYIHGSNLPDDVRDIYVGYDVITENSELTLDGEQEYYIVAKRHAYRYLYYDESAVAGRQIYLHEITDASTQVPKCEWKLDGGTRLDPYNVKLTQGDKWIGVMKSPGNDEGTKFPKTRQMLSAASDDYYDRFMILADPIGYDPYRITLSSPGLLKHYSFYSLSNDNNGESVYLNETYHGTEEMQRRSIRMIPKAPYIYHVINLSGEEAIAGTRYTNALPHANFEINTSKNQLPENIQAFGAQNYVYSKTKNGTYTTNLTITPGIDSYDIYVKYSVDNSAFSSAHINGNWLFTIGEHQHSNLFNYNPQTDIIVGGGYSSFKGTWLINPRKVGEDQDPYDITIYSNYDHSKALGSNSLNSTMTIGNGLEWQNYILLPGGTTSEYTRELTFLVANSGDGLNTPYAYLYVDNTTTPTIIQNNERQWASGTDNPVDLHVTHWNPSINYYIYNLNGNLAVKYQKTGADGVNATLRPTEVMSTLIDDDKWHFWSGSSKEVAFGKDEITTVGDVYVKTTGNGWAAEIYLTYDFTPSLEKDGIDLTGENYYNINFCSSDGINDTPAYWIERPDAVGVSGKEESPAVWAFPLDAQNKVNGEYDLLNDAAIWNIVGSDPYDIILQNYDGKRGHEAQSGNWNSGPYVSLQDDGETGITKFVMLKRSNGDFDILWAYPHRFDGGAHDRFHKTTNGRTNYTLFNSGNKVRFSNEGDYPSAKAAQVHFTPVSKDYFYHIINMNGKKALCYKGKGVPEKEAKKLPLSIQSPLAENFRFYWSNQFNQEKMANGIYELDGEQEPIDVFPPTVDDEGNEILPELYVLYDYKPKEKMDLSAGRMYFLKTNEKYSSVNGTSVVISDDPIKTQPDVDNYLWKVDANDDPYNVRLRVNSTNNMLTADTYEEGEQNITMGTEDATVSAFCLLPGNGLNNENFTLVAATGDSITNNLFAYVSRTEDELQLVRGEDYNRSLNELQVQLEIPKFDYRYRVVNHSDEIAIQYTQRDGESGGTPELPSAIATPFADVTGYYLVEQYAVNGNLYTLHANEQSIEDNGGLPYYNADIYVEYEYNGLTDGLNIEGKFYTLKTNSDALYVYSDNGLKTTATTPSSLTDPTYMLAPTGVTASGDIDPYQITLTTNETTPYTQGKYIAQQGAADGQWVLLSASGTSDELQYLNYDGTSAMTNVAVEPDAASAQLWFHGIPVRIYYAVVSKTTSKIAIIGDFWQEGGDQPALPDLLKSPLADNYTYHSGRAVTGSDQNTTFDVSAMSQMQALPYTETTVYVSYDFDNDNSLLDLNGQVKYNISRGQHYAKLGEAHTDKTSYNGYYVRDHNNPSETERAPKEYLWQLRGQDPYNVTVHNLGHTNPTGAHLTYSNNFGTGTPAIADVVVSTEFTGTYVILNGSENTENGYALVAAFNHSQAYSKYWNRQMTSSQWPDEGYAFLAYQNGTEYRNRNTSPTKNIWPSSNYKENSWIFVFGGRTAADSTSVPFMTLTFTPNQTIPIAYHLTQKISETHHETEPSTVVVKSLFQMPDDWVRKYCEYDYTYYYKKGVDTEGNEVDVPALKSEYDSETAAGVAEVERTVWKGQSTLCPVLYVAADDETTKLDVYVNYTVNEDPANGGIPFNLMANTKESVQALLNNTGGIAEDAFDLTTYEKKIGKPGHSDKRRCDYLYFMVLNTNDNYSKGSQYFLRREDNGRIKWLNNDYQPHVANSKNINGWDYNRCVESYRESDHAAFEDKKWLWCFAGDPYDLYIYNINAVIHEEYNPVTHITESHTHRSHMTGFKKLSNSEFAVFTEDYTAADPDAYRWGLVDGKGDNSASTFSIIGSMIDDEGNYDPSIDNERLYWTMSNSSTDKATEVLLKKRAENFKNLDYNIKVLPYEPLKYEDVNFVIRRADNLTGTRTTGVQELYYAADDRMFVKGDIIKHYESGDVGYDALHGDMKSLPWILQREFCKYTVYSDKYNTIGSKSIGDGPILSSDRDETGHRWVIPTSGDRVQGTNWHSDEDGTQVCNQWAPQYVYVKYEVTSDIFLTQHPNKDKVRDMAENNDHVFFMNFTDNLSQEGYDKGHHAYFDETATFADQASTREKMIWDNAQQKFVLDQKQPYNFCQFKTTTNRMESVPENLKWYFVGDPYAVQVYCTEDAFNTEKVIFNDKTYEVGELGSNLCRFDPTESLFQFVVDCVHLRTPAPTPTDERDSLTIHDQATNQVIGKKVNPNKGKPYYSPFYWEVAPAYSDREGTFSLRFKADNTVLGYNDVYYYLAHDGKTRYYKESTEENPRRYRVNLSYDEDNHRHDRTKYIGYHSANDKDCVIHLVQPTKLYVTAYKKGESTPVVKEELSEYFGYGEQLTDVPRHLKRKYVKYSNWQYQQHNTETWNSISSMPFDLNEANAYNIEDCKFEHVFHIDLKKRISYKLRVDYELDDLTQNGIHLFTPLSDFTAGNLNPRWLDVKVGNDSRSGWLYYDKTKKDATTGIENQTTLLSNFSYSDVAGQKDGWSTGLKGLHWAFIGDPYEFRVINRRRWEDEGMPVVATTSKNFWLGTNYGLNATTEKVKTGRDTNTGEDTYENKQVWYDYLKLGDTDTNGTFCTRTYDDKSPYDGIAPVNGTGQNGNTTWSLIYCKTGGVNDFFMRTASRKTASPGNPNNVGTDPNLVGDYSNKYVDETNQLHNITNDYERLIVKAFTDNSDATKKSAFATTHFDLETKTGNIQKVAIRTVTELDNDGAKNDCFDANVRIYNESGEQKAVLKHVEVVYGNVFDALPYTLRRYGCEYTDCYELFYPDYNNKGSNTTEQWTTHLNELLSNLTNITNSDGMKKVSFVTEKSPASTFNDATLDVTNWLITDANDRRYIEVAYTYKVTDEASAFFTSPDRAKQEDYTWTNAYYKWSETHPGGKTSYPDYIDVFDHYVYSPDGHIIDEVYRKELGTKTSDGKPYSTTDYGWVNSHAGSQNAYGNDTSQEEKDQQKWTFIGDPYDFELKNYHEYLSKPKSTLTYDNTTSDKSEEITFSSTSKTHWAIVQGDQETTIVNGKTVKVTDKDGNPVYLYYLALIDDDPNSPTYGGAIHFVTFERSNGTETLKEHEQYLYTKGGVDVDYPTGNVYDSKNVKPFYISDLISYANIVVYHLVIAHQYSRDPADKAALQALNNVTGRTGRYEKAVWDNINNGTYKEDPYNVLDHLAEWDWYNNRIEGLDRNDGYPLNETKMGELGDKYVKPSSLRDVISDPIADYTVQRVGIGNRLSVPWYMKRQFCTYDLYQRDVMKSVTDYDSPAYDEADADWIAAGKQTITMDGVVYKVDFTAQYHEAGTGRVQKTFIEDGVVKPAYNVKWESVLKTWDASMGEDNKPRGYDEINAQNSHLITRLDESHRNRMVIIDVVYHVNPEEFRFAEERRNTTAWYSMMTNNAKDGLMNFSYKDGIGARHGREKHYTNNYLWAPEGDPYGFVLHNRYATINGTGWDNVVVTTTGELPTTAEDHTITPIIKSGDTFSEGSEQEVDVATYTGAVSDTRFDYRRIMHRHKDEDGAKTWAARNAVYEMFTGKASNLFLMHPTNAYLDISGDKFSSFYMTHNTTIGSADFHRAELQYVADATELRENDDANWRLYTTPEQLLPYFERSGYVGGLVPTIANNHENIDLYNTLQNYQSTYRNDPTVINFPTIDKARKLVYSGKFYTRGSNGSYTSELAYDKERPGSRAKTQEAMTAANDSLPLKFVSNNLVPLQRGYYRIRAFSDESLDKDGSNIDGTGQVGILGPRYISGYRHQSEMEKSGYENGVLQDGSRWLHFYETDEAHTTFHTFKELNSVIENLDSYHYRTRDIQPHPALRGNNDILPAEYDPSSIFYFEPVTPESGKTLDRYDRYTFGTQNLRVRGRAGGVQAVAGDNVGGNEYSDISVDPENFGITKMVNPTTLHGKSVNGSEGQGTFDDRFRTADIGGTAVTLRLMKNEDGGDFESMTADNMKTNYLCIDANHRYRVTIHTNNELKEVGDGIDHLTAEEYWQLDDINYGIQDTKWLLQPVGTKTDWPYNQMPLRLKVNAGGQKPDTSTGKGLPGAENKDHNYYASLYVPFDTRLNSTIDVAFTNIKADPMPYSITLSAVSQLNGTGNPQFIPAGWPVIIRTSKPKTGHWMKQDATDKKLIVEDPSQSFKYVELNLPTRTPTSIPEGKAKIKLYGEYLEQEIDDAHIDAVTNNSTWAQGRDVMVFGLPFVEGENDKTVWSNTSDGKSLDYYTYETSDAVGFYTNENWWRGHTYTPSSGGTESEIHDNTLAHAHWSTARNATSQQRNNKYVYHNKAYFVYDWAPGGGGGGAKPRLAVIFDGDEDYTEEPEMQEEPEEPIFTEQENTDPWPCDVYDLQGRRVARNETPEGLRRNHPGLPRGVYIFGNKKVIVK